mgnify:CR=1 FL=1
MEENETEIQQEKIQTEQYSIEEIQIEKQQEEIQTEQYRIEEIHTADMETV